MFVLSVLLLGMPAFALESTTFHLEEGLPNYEIYDQSEIGAHKNIGAITFDKIGRLIVGSQNMLSVYDGQTWSNIHKSATESENAFKFLSLYQNGQLLVVSDNNIGHISINLEGDYEITPIGPQNLSNKLNASNAQGICIHENDFYIYSESILSSYDENGFATQWAPIEELLTVFEFDGDIYVSSKNDGLMKAKNGFFEYPEMGEQLDGDMAVVSAISLEESKALFLTAGKGLFTYDGEIVLPFGAESGNAFDANIDQICKLGEHHVAASVKDQGIVVLNAEGNIVQRFDRSIDRRFNQVTHIQSSDGTLWATLRDSIARIEYPSPYTYYSQLLDVPLNAFNNTRHDGKLWITAGEKLFDNSLEEKDLVYTPFPTDLSLRTEQIPVQARFASSTEFGLMVASERDILLFNGSTPTVIARNISAKFLLPLEHKEDTIVWASESEIGLLIHKGNSWELSSKTIEIPQVNTHLTEDEFGYVWVELDSGRIAKLTLAGNDIDLEVFSHEHGLSEHSIEAWKHGDQVLFSQYDTLLEYNKHTNFFQPVEELVKHLPENTKKIRRAATDSNGNIWIPTASKNLILRPDKVHGYRLDRNTASKTNKLDIGAFKADSEGIVWAIGSDEVIRIDPKLAPTSYDRWQTHIDKITLSDKQRVIYHSLDGNELNMLELPYEDNSLVFHFTTPTTSESTSIDHQAFLEGFSQNWTHVDNSNVFIIANLHEGDYTLRTRVLVGDEIINQIDAISFSIKPPFYRAPLAYLIYAICFCGLVIFLGTKFSQAAQKENVRLHSLVSARTNELKVANEKLKETAKRAEAANRAKSVFLASMSHEIRTPLNGVVGMTSLLKQTDLTSDQHELVGIIENSGENVVNIINDILDYSKIEAGKIELDYAPFGLRETVELAMDLFIEQVSKKNIEFAYLIHEDVPNLTIGDALRIRQVLVNLIGNAIKFTESGHIFVHLTLLSEKDDISTIEFTVEDTGIGIPSEKIDLLFRSFSQVNSNRDQQYGGTGLGLAISKRLVEIMGGDIVVESKESNGSKFIFRLPFKKEHAPIPFEDTNKLSNKRILVVEDSPLQQRIFEYHAAQWQTEIVLAGSFKETLEIAHNTLEKFDVALIDMQLPDVSGNELVAELLNLPAFQKTAFISIASNSLAKASNDFSLSVPKPIKPRFLYNCINQVIDYPKSDNLPTPPMPSSGYNKSNTFETDLKILLVDDNETNRKVGRMLLSKLGYQTVEVENGLEAVEAIKNDRFEIILMDVQMPVMDGKEATKQIRHLELDYKPWIIAVTAGAMRGDMNKAFESGMDDFLSKPVLLETLRKTMERAQSAVENRASTT